jgi:response regulator RpfG family c-di-GMP phosphodiesterase
MLRKILFVDDDTSLLEAFQRSYRNQFEFDIALGGDEALNRIKSSGPYALVVADMNMPGMNGVQLLERIMVLAPETVRVMLTGNADQLTAVNAVNRGAVYRFLNKPCPADILVPVLESALKQYEMQQMEKELLEGTLTGSVKLMSEVLGMVAPEALGHGQRLRDIMRQFALFIGATPAWELEVAALLSSIGYASLPAGVLAKIGSGADRTVEEEKLVRNMPQVGHDLLIEIPRFKGVANIVLFQNKAFDGSDYPAIRCAGEQIPIGARILRILGDRMSLESEGVVRRRALETMQSRKGAYDPRVLEQCFLWTERPLIHQRASVSPVRTVRLDELKTDQTVAVDIRLVNRTILIGAGHRLSPMMLRRLKNHEALGELVQPATAQIYQ